MLVVATAVLIFLFAIFLAKALRTPALVEPVFQNKALGQWLWEYSQSHSNRPAAEAAVHAIGTNALPFLLVELSDTENPTLGRVKANTQQLLKMRIISGADRAALALAGFEILGTNAHPAIPDLIEMLRDADPYVGGHDPAWQAIGALHRIGSRSIPPLISATTNSNEMIRVHACLALAELRATHAVPSLIERLSDPSRMVRIRAALALGTLQADQTNSVPALALALSDPDSAVRFSAANSLAMFGSRAAAAAPDLQQALNQELTRPPGHPSGGGVFQEKDSAEVTAAIRTALKQIGPGDSLP
jgi:hypothetical protein